MANRVTLAKKFIDMGVDVNRRNLYYDTPLHIAAKLGYTAMVSLLCSAGANPFIKNMRSHGRSFDAMDMAYRHMLKAHRSEEAPHDYYHSYNIYRTILHIMYRYVDRFGGAVLGGAFV
jgi:ankyrin repeat protein